MTVTVNNYAYNKNDGTRIVEQTVVYTRADDIANLAQAIMALGNLYRVLESAPVGVSIDSYNEKIAEAKKKVDDLQKIVDGYED